MVRGEEGGDVRWRRGGGLRVRKKDVEGGEVALWLVGISSFRRD